MRRLIFPLALMLAVLGAGGCNTPQIPLPPPVVEDMSFQLTDRASETGRLRGNGENTPQMAGATVRVINLRDDYGVLAPAGDDGSFETRPFVVRDGDDLRVDYSFDEERSDSVCVTVGYDEPVRACPSAR
jgi:hypothetical protein